MEPFWSKIRAMKPWLAARLRPSRATARSTASPQERMNVDPQGVALHQLRLLRLRSATRWSPIPSFSARRRSRRGCASSATRATRAKVERLEEYNGRARHLGLHALLLLQRALPEGRRPARRDRQARRRVDQGRDRPRHGREAREVVRHARRRRRAGCARPELVPKTQGDRLESIKQMKFALSARQARQGCAAVPAARRAQDVGRGARALQARARAGPSTAAPGIVQGEHALRSSRTDTSEGARSVRRRARSRSRTCPRRTTTWSTREHDQCVKRVAYYKGCLASLSAKELDTLDAGARAAGRARARSSSESVTCCGAGDIHEAEPDYYLHLNARDPRVRRGDGLPTRCSRSATSARSTCARRTACSRATQTLRERVNENLDAVGVPPYAGTRRGAPPALGDRRGRRLRAAEGSRRTRG